MSSYVIYHHFILIYSHVWFYQSKRFQKFIPAFVHFSFQPLVHFATFGKQLQIDVVEPHWGCGHHSSGSMYTFVCGAAALWLRRLSVGARKGWKESPYYHPEKWTKAHVPTINFHGINRYSFQRGGVYNSFLEKEAIEILGDFVGWVLHLGSLKFWKAWKQLLGWLLAVPTSPKRLDKWNPLEVNLAQTAGVSLDLHGLKWNMN